MKTKIRPFNKILIGLGMLALAALAVWGVSCSQPARSVPPQASAIARQSATPGQPLTRVPLTATEATATLGATATLHASAPVIVSTPTPTLTAEEWLAHELIQPGGQVTYSAGGCDKILKTEPWCSVISQQHLSHAQSGASYSLEPTFTWSRLVCRVRKDLSDRLIGSLSSKTVSVTLPKPSTDC